MNFSILIDRTAPIVAAGGFLLLAVFQVSLALGAPLGRAAWGGVHGDVLPPPLRVGSAVSAVVLAAAAFIVLGRGGYLKPTPWPSLVRRGTWVLCAIMALSALANFASSSSWERLLGGPVALLLALLCFVVANGRAGR